MTRTRIDGAIPREVGVSRPAATVRSVPIGHIDKHNPSPLLLSLDDAATLSGLSVWTLRDLIASGELRAVRLPGIRRVLIDKRDLEKAIESWKS